MLNVYHEEKKHIFWFSESTVVPESLHFLKPPSLPLKCLWKSHSGTFSYLPPHLGTAVYHADPLSYSDFLLVPSCLIAQILQQQERQRQFFPCGRRERKGQDGNNRTLIRGWIKGRVCGYSLVNIFAPAP